MSTEDTPKPVAWMMVNTDHPRLTPSVALTPQTGWHITWETHPLFNQATIDAAVAKERVRWVKLCDDFQPRARKCEYGAGAGEVLDALKAAALGPNVRANRETTR